MLKVLPGRVALPAAPGTACAGSAAGTVSACTAAVAWRMGAALPGCRMDTGMPPGSRNRSPTASQSRHSSLLGARSLRSSAHNGRQSSTSRPPHILVPTAYSTKERMLNIMAFFLSVKQ